MCSKTAVRLTSPSIEWLPWEPRLSFVSILCHFDKTVLRTINVIFNDLKKNFWHTLWVKIQYDLFLAKSMPTQARTNAFLASKDNFGILFWSSSSSEVENLNLHSSLQHGISYSRISQFCVWIELSSGDELLLLLLSISLLQIYMSN